jgi:hypothetical protein
MHRSNQFLVEWQLYLLRRVLTLALAGATRLVRLRVRQLLQ